jgi:arginine repressor
MHMVDILGCVAGDDTILLVARTESVAQSICNRLSMMNKTI